MNAFYFYPALASTFLGVLTFRISPSHSAKPVPDQAAVQHEMDTSWVAAEDDTDRFRTLSMQEIEAYALTVQTMASRCERGELASRPYLHARLEALREHVDYARTEALKLPSSHGDEDFPPALAHFHRTLMSLEGAFSQAADELSNGA